MGTCARGGGGGGGKKEGEARSGERRAEREEAEAHKRWRSGRAPRGSPSRWARGGWRRSASSSCLVCARGGASVRVGCVRALVLARCAPLAAEALATREGEELCGSGGGEGASEREGEGGRMRMRARGRGGGGGGRGEEERSGEGAEVKKDAGRMNAVDEENESDVRLFDAAGKLIGEAESLQNSPAQGLHPKEDLASGHVRSRMRTRRGALVRARGPHVVSCLRYTC